MSVLDKLKQKKKERLTQKHLLSNEDISTKYPYCIGVAMQALVDENLGEKEEEALADLVYSMGLSEDYKEKVKEAVQSGDEDLIDGIIDVIDTNDKKYMFILDLYKISYTDKTISEGEKEAINIFADMLHLEGFEKEFLGEFAKASVNFDNKMACKAYEELMKSGIEASFNILKYFMDKFEYVQTIEGYELSTGEVLVLNNPCIINGMIKVTSGARLVINGADIQLAGQIWVNGGQISIDDANIQAIEGCEETMFCFDNVSKVAINNTTFDGNTMVSTIDQRYGSIEINNSKLKNTNVNSAIKFGGKMCIVNKCIFDDCVSTNYEYGGGAIYLSSGEAFIVNCEFNNCEAIDGGAICNYAAGVKINKSIFNSCNAQNLGSAVYANIGATVTNCEYNNCSPADDVFCNCKNIERV